VKNSAQRMLRFAQTVDSFHAQNAKHADAILFTKIKEKTGKRHLYVRSVFS